MTMPWGWEMRSAGGADRWEAIKGNNHTMNASGLHGAGNRAEVLLYG